MYGIKTCKINGQDNNTCELLSVGHVCYNTFHAIIITDIKICTADYRW